jgi:predicted secreted protein
LIHTLREASFPYKDLSSAEILSAAVKIPPRGFQMALGDDEVEALVAILRTVEIDSPDYGVEREGGQTVFALAMSSGAEIRIYAYNNVIALDGLYTVEPHETEAGCTLSEFGKSVAEDTYLQFLGKIANSRYASSASITHATTGQLFYIVLDENQSLPGRWKPAVSDNDKIALIRDEIDLSGAAPSGMPGAGGEKHTFYFEALHTGECTIEMNLAFGNDEIAETESYTVRIEE